MFYLFPCVLPITKGNVLKTFLIGLVALVAGLYFATNLAPAFTLAANDVYAATKDVAVKIPEGFSAGAALDFASALLCWTIYHLVASFKWIGSGFLVLFTAFLMYLNYRRIKNEK
jgi:PTS system galactitol-specific IIC component